jgi:Holliday junction resolvase-like predicted endonuclease
VLRTRGFRIVGRRATTPEGELDLVAWRSGKLWVFEVKTSRVSRASFDPRYAPGRRCSARQRRRIERAARAVARSLGAGAGPELALIEVWLGADEQLAAWRVTDL